MATAVESLPHMHREPSRNSVDAYPSEKIQSSEDGEIEWKEEDKYDDHDV